MASTGSGQPAGDGGGLGGEHDDGERGRQPARHAADVDEHGDGRRTAAPVAAPATAPLAAQASGEPGSRRAASWPATAPTSAPPKATDRSRWTTGRASTARRGTGASSRWRTSGASTETGPPSLPLRSPRATATATANAEHGRAAVEDVGDLGRRRRGVGDEPAQPQHDAAADEGREVHAVGDLEPLQVAESAHPPGPSQLLHDARHAATNATPGRAVHPGAPVASVERAVERRDASAPRPYFTPVDVEAAQLFFSLLALVALGRCRRRSSSPGCSPAARPRPPSLVAAVDDAALWIAFLVAATATAGSLYFSEVADFVPCRLCWFQRIAMYPLAVDPARRRDPPRPRRALVRRPARRHRRRRSRRTTTSSSGSRRWRAAPAASARRAPTSGSASSAS